MGYRLGLVFLIILMLLVPSTTSGDLDVIVETDLSGYIMEDHLNLSGTTNTSISYFEDTTTTHFENGTTDSLEIIDGKVQLIPEERPVILNNGSAILSRGTGAAWDTYLMDLFVFKHNGTYWMYYAGCRSTSLMSARHIGLATSTDGINFTKYSGNPIVKSRVNTYDYTNIMQPVVMVENDNWHMWYGGNHGNTWAGENQDIDICYATSTDGKSWTKYSSNPVIKNGSPDSAWNGISVRPSDIVKSGNKYILFYKGVGDTGGQGAKPKLGSHSSTDLTTWTANPNNPIYKPKAGSWESDKTNFVSVEKRKSDYRMWTWTGLSTEEIGYLTSTDLENWTDSGSAYISPKTGTIYSQDICYPRWVEETGYNKLYFKGQSSGYYTFGVFKLIPKTYEGTFTSGVFNATAKVDLTGIDWNWTNTGGGWIETSVRWTNDTDAWGTWRTFDNSTEPLGVQAQYFQYSVTLNVTSDSSESSLDRFKLEYSNPVTEVEVSIDGGAYQAVKGTLPDWWANVSLHDGDYDISLRVTDSTGSRVTIVEPVKVDLYPPTGSILIEQGEWAVGSTTVNIALTASDTHGPFEMQLSRQPDFPGAQWTDLITSADWQMLGDPEGNVTIYVRFRDDAGRISETYNDTIVIDTTPPTGILRINNGDKYTNSTYVDLSLTWADLTGVVAMMVSNDPFFAGASWEDPRNALGWLLDDTGGERAVYVRLRDLVGWETTLVDTIILDGTPPGASLSINGDDNYTNSRDVDLSIALYDANPIRIKLANSDGLWPDTFMIIETPTVVPWTLSPGPDGLRSVRMLVEDAASNEYVTSDKIVLDTVAPLGRMELNGGASFTNNLLAEGDLVASDATSGLDKMRVGGSEDLDGVAWQTMRDSFHWLLPSGDGTKTVYVQILDRAGNTATIDASIILDTTPPDGTFSIEGAGEFTMSSLVTLLIDMNDEYGLADMRLTNEFGFTDEEWVPYSTSYSWDLGTSGGPKRVLIEVRDNAGNSFAAPVSTILDLLDPYAHINIELGAEATLVLTVDTSWSANDNLGLASIAFSEDPAFTDATWLDLEGEKGLEDVGSFTFSPGDGLKTIHVRVIDRAGRTGGTSDSIWYVSERPEGTVTLGDGSGWSNAPLTAVTVHWTGGSAATHYRISKSEVEGFSDWLPIEGTTSIILGTKGGPRTVHAWLLGPHNVTSLVLNGTVTLDLVAPTVGISRPDRAVVEDEAVTLSIAVSDDLDPSPSVRWRVNGKDWKEYADDTKLTLREGDNHIEVEATDAAGNDATTEWTVTLERNVFVGGSSWLILLVIIVVAVVVSLYYWTRKNKDMDGQ